MKKPKFVRKDISDCLFLKQDIEELPDNAVVMVNKGWLIIQKDDLELMGLEE